MFVGQDRFKRKSPTVRNSSNGSSTVTRFLAPDPGSWSSFPSKRQLAAKLSAPPLRSPTQTPFRGPASRPSSLSIHSKHISRACRAPQHLTGQTKISQRRPLSHISHRHHGLPTSGSCLYVTFAPRCPAIMLRVVHSIAGPRHTAPRFRWAFTDIA